LTRSTEPLPAFAEHEGRAALAPLKERGQAMKLDNSIAAVVTGGASGLGAATVRALAAKGVKVAIFDLQEEKGRAIAEEVGGTFCEVNVTSDESVDAGFEKARAAHGQERILVNCAGVANAIKTVGRDKETGAIKPFPMDAFKFVVEINLIGTFRCISKSAAGMLTLDPLDEFGERGAIVNTASVAAEDGQMGQAAYSASKGGVVGMTLPIARDLMNEGIRVNTILPGIFQTPLMMSLPEKAQQVLAASVPFPKRLGMPEEYAKLALTMIEVGYFNGEDVRLDGAIRMPPR
jgi:NAD(P)-dependent dehydrogenase (short-subunit alcohol dehydrogenase family)